MFKKYLMNSDPHSVLTRSRPSSHEPSFSISTRQLGILILFISLGILFVASIVAYLVTRYQNVAWQSAEIPPLPSGLYVSALLAAAISASMHVGLKAIRDNRSLALTRALRLTAVLAAGFLAVQALNWQAVREAQLAADSRALYAFTFYMLTALHALHVFGGFVPLAVVMHRAAKQEYSSSRHEGVLFCAQYWDFLGVVWFTLLAIMLLTS